MPKFDNADSIKKNVKILLIIPASLKLHSYHFGAFWGGIFLCMCMVKNMWPSQFTISLFSLTCY